MDDLQFYLTDALSQDLGVTTAEIDLTTEGLDVDYVRRCILLGSFFKKYQDGSISQNADTKALEKFLSINDALCEGPFVPPIQTSIDELFFSYLRDNFNRGLEDRWEDDPQATSSPDGSNLVWRGFGYDWIGQNCWTGPGSAVDADSTWIQSKLFECVYSWSNSEELIPIYRAALSNTGLLAAAEMRRNKNFGFKRVEGERTFFAFKNAEISRTCGTQPSLNLLIQMAVGRFFQLRLGTNFGINLSLQPIYNRRLAQIGSQYRSFTTTDLTSASDHVSVPFVDWVMDESSLKRCLMLSRSGFAVLPSGEKKALRMMSTMGNGYTFPLQTYIFACIVRSVYQLKDLKSASPVTDFGVFGDDIIVASEAHDYLIRALGMCGFKVNVDKTFHHGPFRESCGGDFYDGYNVRGVYVKSLKTPQNVVSAVNRLNRWSARYGIKLPKTVKTLLAITNKRGHLRVYPKVPPTCQDDAGLQVPLCYTKPIVAMDKQTLNYGFQYKYWSPKKEKLSAPEPESSENPEGSMGLVIDGHIGRPDHSLKDDLMDESVPTVLSGLSIEYTPRRGHDQQVYYKIRMDITPYWDNVHSGDAWEGVSAYAWKTYGTFD